MRLIDCFIESLAYTVDVIEDAEKGLHRDCKEVQSHIVSQLGSLYGLSVQGGYSESQYRLALFSTIAFIDEKLVIFFHNWCFLLTSF